MNTYTLVLLCVICSVTGAFSVSAQDTHKETVTLSHDASQEILANVKEAKLKKAIEKKIITLHSTTYYKKLEK